MNSEIVKLVLAGPVGAGKTTAIRSVADSEPISTEMPLADGPMGDKTTTTVALDFATVQLDDGTPLFIYGLPGQEHFKFMRGIVFDGAIGVIVILDGGSDDLATQCEHWLRAAREVNSSIGIVIGITKSETNSEFSMRPVRDAIRRCGPAVPAFTFDARDRAQTSHLVRALLLSLQ